MGVDVGPGVLRLALLGQLGALAFKQGNAGEDQCVQGAHFRDHQDIHAPVLHATFARFVRGNRFLGAAADNPYLVFIDTGGDQVFSYTLCPLLR